MKKSFSKKQHLLFFIMLAAVMLLISIYLYGPEVKKDRQGASSPEALLTQVLSCPQGENTKSYSCTVPYISSYLKDHDIDPFFDLLEEKTKTDTAVGAYCHSLGHSIGRGLHATYGFTEALNKCNPFCADGCTMGILESFLSSNLDQHITIEAVTEKATKACGDFSKSDPVKLAACIHGVGHGLMPLVSYDTQEGLDLCSTMQTADKGSCYDAVFMEKFLPSDDTRKVSQTENIYEYCASYDNEEYKFRCFGYLPYAWQTWGKTPNEVLSLCSDPEAHTEGCGWALVRLYLPGFNTRNDMTFFDLYHKSPTELKKPMYKYGSILLIEYSPSKANIFCKEVDGVYDKCLDNMEKIAQSMGIVIP